MYAGGNFINIGGAPRNHIAALDALTGAATTWDPNADDIVFSLAVSGSTVYAGGTFTKMGGAMRAGIAAIEAVPTDVTLESFDAMANADGVVLTWTTSHEWDHVGFHVYRAGDAAGPYERRTMTLVRGHNLYRFVDGGVEPSGTYHYRLGAVNRQGQEELMGHVMVTIATPSRTMLFPSFPNPFAQSTLVRFAVADAGPLTLALYDVRGRLVREFVKGNVSAGAHVYRWDGGDGSGRPVADGVYFFKLDTSGTRLTQKVVRRRER